ncbi:MAG: EAL domain-containing protein [Methylomonas sp.]|jgi:predicted signal transduction protein with EAL and GGDEF domain|uniref:EAL domain-containing protein n=1 Tax=Methylomonas sp. TaxID=418 RepID=UPI0025FC4679|nr:EAL domain-containing protein [Methylomonas sp.]MCK9605009.1 EAL domain-containing protein [Methylomonas sp.]
MGELFNDAFNFTGLIPHGYCLKWNPLLLWTLVGSDSIIAVSYFSIPFALWYFTQKRADIRNRWLFILFGLFIVACGITHFLDVLTIWRPNYWANAIAKAATAGLSFGTAVIIWLKMPEALLAPSVQQLEQAKADLEILNTELERRVGERTEALADTNRQLQGTLSELTLLHERLKTEKAQLRGLINNIPDFIFIKNTDSTYVACNKAVENYFGVPESEIIGKSDFEFVDADTATSFRRKDQETLASDLVSVYEEWITYADGRECCLETLKIPFRDEHQNILGIIGVGRDITERKQADIKLQLAARVFTHAREGIMIADAMGTIIEVNDTFTQITGYSRKEAVGQNPRILQSGLHGPDFYADIWRALLENGHWYGEIWNRHKNGKVFAEMITISAVNDASGKVQNYVALFTDITQMKEHQQELERIAHYDALTGLPNRVLLTDRLQQAMLQNERRNQSLALVYLDLDGFKVVNDSYDHQVGDELLIAISKRMKEALREGDTLARIGGDEFVAILVDLEQITDCEPVLARLLQAASSSIQLENAELQLSASIGVTLHPQDNVEADQLVRHADQAMYIAKQEGKNRYHLFDIEHDAAIKTQQERLEDIRSAMGNQEFVLYYQPKINIVTGEVIGVEALIRWQHPQRGLLSPADFLPFIETHPISVSLGEWVIDSVLAQMREWYANGIDIIVSVNIGAKQFQQIDFVDRIALLLSVHPDIQPSRLELEVLETSALEDLAAVSKKIKACREMGLRFALDDFGTGFSSLTYLRHLPVDILKIDQSFVRGMLVDQDDLAIVNGVIGLANTFSRQVIAEGVETMNHAKKLVAMGCQLAQGYGIAHPMPATEIAVWVSKWQASEYWKK